MAASYGIFRKRAERKEHTYMINISSNYGQWDEAMVVFSPEVQLWWLRFLKKGFKHCFVILSNEQNLVVIDPLRNRTEICVMSSFPLARMQSLLEANGYITVRTNVRQNFTAAVSLGLFSCVEMAKRLLGIHKFSIITPYRLYKFLNKDKNMKIILDNYKNSYYI